MYPFSCSVGQQTFVAVQVPRQQCRPQTKDPDGQHSSPSRQSPGQQSPLQQTSPSLQVRRQYPQLLVSEKMSVQTPLQQASLLAQA
jgi:hypothetical protein